MEMQQEKRAAKLAAYITLLGSICMLSGAVMMVMSGTDLDQALYGNDLAGYLKSAMTNQNILIANLSFWILGVILLGLGANMMALLSSQKSVLTQVIRYNYGIAVPLVVLAYLAWLAVVVRLASSSSTEAATIAEAIGWFASHADWVSTVLIVGTGPMFISAAGRDSWVPNWLRIWSYIAFFAGILNVMAHYSGGLTTYGFLIIPVGLGWMIAAAITLFRNKTFSQG
ncbi:MAG: hypothetical protein GC192_07270 [Bacteroidetes bacterium]|nr:hypothetical protein [Bacteroidota bacterium]